MTPGKPWHRWVFAAIALLLFILALVLIERFTTLDSTTTVVVRVAFILLGLVSAGAIAWYLRPEQKPVSRGADDALLVIKAAQERLPGASLTSRPVVLVMGPEGSTKTTLVARSTGANPELLAGASPSSLTEAPVPTRDVNLWLMQQAVITEIGGALLQDAPRWLQAVRAFREAMQGDKGTGNR